MMTQTKIQIKAEDYQFIKAAHKELNYKTQSEYMRDAIRVQVAKDRIRLRQLKREAAMEMIGKAAYENLFESIEGDDFESR